MNLGKSILTLRYLKSYRTEEAINKHDKKLNAIIDRFKDCDPDTEHVSYSILMQARILLVKMESMHQALRKISNITDIDTPIMFDREDLTLFTEIDELDARCNSCGHIETIKSYDEDDEEFSL